MEGWDDYLIYNSQENILRETLLNPTNICMKTNILQCAPVKILKKGESDAKREFNK